MAVSIDDILCMGSEPDATVTPETSSGGLSSVLESNQLKLVARGIFANLELPR